MNFQLAESAYKKIDFLIDKLKVHVTELKIRNMVSTEEINELGQRMRKCPQLQTVKFTFCKNFS